MVQIKPTVFEHRESRQRVRPDSTTFLNYYYIFPARKTAREGQFHHTRIIVKLACCFGIREIEKDSWSNLKQHFDTEFDALKLILHIKKRKIKSQLWLRTVMVFIYDETNPRVTTPSSNLFSLVQPYWFQKQSCELKEKKFSRSRRCISVNHVFIAKKLCEITRETRGWFINRNLPQQTGCAQFHRRSSDSRGKQKKTFESSWTSRERNTTVKSLPFSPPVKKMEKVWRLVCRESEKKKKRSEITLK